MTVLTLVQVFPLTIRHSLAGGPSASGQYNGVDTSENNANLLSNEGLQFEAQFTHYLLDILITFSKGCFVVVFYGHCVDEYPFFFFYFALKVLIIIG